MLRAVLIVMMVVAPALAGDLDPLFAHVERAVKEDRAAVEEMVRELEARPLPASRGRSELIEGLAAALARQGERALAQRVRALPIARLRAHVQRRVDPLAFPADHGVHGGSFAEWWYFTGNLAAGADRYGFEVSFFRTAVGVYFVHTALTDVARRAHPWQRYYVRPSHATFAPDRLDVRMAGNSARENERGDIEVKLAVRGQKLSLTLTPERAPMIVNGDGVIDMPEGTTSRYYSFTRMATTGTLTTADGRKIRLSGRSWFDHQWGNFIALFRPWDWFSFQMEDGSDYNLFHFRPGPGFAGRSHVNVLRPDGKLEVSRDLAIARLGWWKSPRSGKYYVTRWTLTSPGGRDETFEVTTPVEDQEMPRANLTDIPPAYWEGTIDVVRTCGDGTSTRGVGYAEHMPYRRPVHR